MAQSLLCVIKIPSPLLLYGHCSLCTKIWVKSQLLWSVKMSKACAFEMDGVLLSSWQVGAQSEDEYLAAQRRLLCPVTIWMFPEITWQLSPSYVIAKLVPNLYHIWNMAFTFNMCTQMNMKSSCVVCAYLKNPDQKSSMGFRELRGGWNVGPAQFAPGVNIAYNLIQPLLPTPLLFWLRIALAAHVYGRDMVYLHTVQLKGPFAIWKLFVG